MASGIWLPVEIGEAALSRNEHYPVRDWLLLRFASDGKGHCREAVFRTFLGKLFGRTAVNAIVDRLIASGMATRNMAHGQYPVLVLMSTRALLARYALPKSTYSISIPLTFLKGNGWRGILSAYVRAGKGETPFARETMESRTGVTKPTQLRGERKLGGQVQDNFARIELQDPERAAATMPCSANGGGRRTYRVGSDLYRQIPSTVRFPSIERKKRIIRASRSNCPCNAGGQLTTGRRYFASPRQTHNRRPCYLNTDGGRELLTPYLDEGTKRIGPKVVGVWGPVN